jgi:glycosyltransferase involved in cell wall biosynthesis
VPVAALEAYQGIEDFHYPSTRRIPELLPGADILQLHNLHGGYFDLRELPALARWTTVVFSPHDMWLATGHCAHTLDSDRWLTGCGDCPHLDTYPAIRRDATRRNWQRKQAIYRGVRAHLVAPSDWLRLRLERSMLAPALASSRTIRNGVDLEAFRPSSGATRPVDRLLFVGRSARTSPWRDFALLREALVAVGVRRRLELVVVGDEGETEVHGGLTVKYAGTVPTAALAKLYQTATLYVHPARADTFPTSVLEALASGVPVVASGVGGIPEQVTRATGRLVTNGHEFAAAVEQLLDDDDGRRRAGIAARQDAEQRFDARRQVSEYLSLLAELSGTA